MSLQGATQALAHVRDGMWNRRVCAAGFPTQVRLVGLAMTATGGDGRGSVRLSDRTIARQWSMAEHEVHRAVDVLVDAGWLVEIPRDASGRRRFHLVAVQPDANARTHDDIRNDHRAD